MQFTPEQVEQFRTQGFLAVPNFWTQAEVAAMQAELERFKRDGLLYNVATEGDGQTESQSKANLQLCPMWPHSEFFRAMPFAPKVAQAVEQLIGGPVVLHLDQVFLKPAQHGAGTNWHQDNAYFKIEDPLSGTALWTAVHNATIHNGTMRVIPNVFRESLDHARDPDSNHHIRCYPDESKAELIELPAGGALFFAYGTPHATGPNTTDKDRAGVALHFINQKANGEAKGGFQAAQRPLLSGPAFQGGAESHGVDLRDDWQHQVERVLTEL